MGDVLSISLTMRKDELYAGATQRIDQLLRREPDMFANFGNIMAILKTAFNFYWVGFYVRRDSDLVLGPFQGPEAPSRLTILPKPQSVCGHAAIVNSALVINDITETNDYPVHVNGTRSEIAVPLLWRGRTELIISVADPLVSVFDDADRRGLEGIMRLIEKRYYR